MSVVSFAAGGFGLLPWPTLPVGYVLIASIFPGLFNRGMMFGFQYTFCFGLSSSVDVWRLAR